MQAIGFFVGLFFFPPCSVVFKCIGDNFAVWRFRILPKFFLYVRIAMPLPKEFCRKIFRIRVAWLADLPRRLLA
ncbi:MAG: hypothetical protein GY862_17555 [Gammaproteobacteria bacterium]|nr:hypothetical protein [Gammaproteobacteria bacterium]